MDGTLMLQATNFSTLWKGILSIKESSYQNISFSVGSGGKLLFWLDLWVGDTPLALHFPNLFSFARDKEAKLQSCLEKVGNQVVWGPIFR